MIISTTSIALQSARTYQEEHRISEKLTLWQTGESPPAPRQDLPGLEERTTTALAGHLEQVTLSTSGIAKARSIQGIAEPVPAGELPIADVKIRILKALIERLTGKKIVLEDPGRFYQQQASSTQPGEPLSADHGAQPTEQSAGWGMIYEYHESYAEQEKTTFSANGTIVTGDGRTIDFSAHLSMERTFFSEEYLSLRAGDALKDPLVINFAGTDLQLSDTTFSFDLDRDGKKDQLRFVSPGSGYLALDRNGDGVVNDGGELFGPVSGNGFADLQAYDQDGNGWIDETDDVYDRLRIWTRDDDGQVNLFALGEKGVGALYLGHVSTPFSLKDDNNELLGQVRSSSVFLGEDGRVGTVQQIDLVV